MNDQQLLSDLLEWFAIMCNLDLQSEADEILLHVPYSDGTPADVGDWAEFRVLTDSIKEEIEARKQLELFD